MIHKKFANTVNMYILHGITSKPHKKEKRKKTNQFKKQ